MVETVNKSRLPAISVVMSVYNGEEYLRDAIDSILRQTFTDFEFIIIDDGSTDQTLKIIKQYRDSRIRLVSRENRGLIASLNEGIDLAKADYIARQDADDISMPTRFEKQFAYLKSHQETAVLGSSFSMINEKGQELAIFGVPCNDTDIKRALFFRNPLAHGSVFLNRRMILQLGAYPTGVGPIEDYELWARVFNHDRVFSAIPEVLYRWRHNLNGISSVNTNQQAKLVRELQARLWVNKMPPKQNILYIWKSYNKYRSQFSKRYYYVVERFVRDERSLGVALWRANHRAAALRQFIAFTSMVPTNIIVIQQDVQRFSKRVYHELRHMFGQFLKHFKP